jgi:WD40 repeat protein
MKGTELIVICSSQTNKVVKKWDTLTYIKQDDDLTDIGCINANALVQVEQSMVAIGDIAMIYIVDVVKWRKIKEIRNVFLNGRLVFSLAYAGNYLLYVGCENGDFATINLDCDDDNDVVYSDDKYMHTNSINAIVIKDRKQVITASSDELVRVWDIVGKKRVIPFTPLPYQL